MSASNFILADFHRKVLVIKITIFIQFSNTSALYDTKLKVTSKSRLVIPIKIKIIRSFITILIKPHHPLLPFTPTSFNGGVCQPTSVISITIKITSLTYHVLISVNHPEATCNPTPFKGTPKFQLQECQYPYQCYGKFIGVP